MTPVNIITTNVAGSTDPMATGNSTDMDATASKETNNVKDESNSTTSEILSVGTVEDSSSTVSSSTSSTTAKETNINESKSTRTNTIPTEILSEGTEVTKVKGSSSSSSYVGKIKKIKKKNNNIKYQIDWYNASMKTRQSPFNEDVEWYDSTSIKKLSTKRVIKINKRFSFDSSNNNMQHLVSEKEKIRVFKEARKALLLMPCDYPITKINESLHEEGYPYGLQGVMNRLLDKIGFLDTKFPTLTKCTKLKPIKYNNTTLPSNNNDSVQLHNVDLTGKIIRKTFNHMEHEGVVMHKYDEHEHEHADADTDHEILYHIKYDDGDEEDLDGYEVIRHLYPRLDMPPCLGRRLQCLELFAGTCVVSDAFYYREWDCHSMDINTCSNATTKKDILHIEPEEDIKQVPDFIWASPPCETYSLLAGGIHRCLQDNELERSPKARQHNYIFMKMVQIMTWAKIRHPHLIVVIENPVGKLIHMPLMKEFVRHFDLQPVNVHYCTFGRDERKATVLWTNYPNLKDHLEDFKCGIHRCSVGMKHMGVRTNTKNFDFSSIPEPLATEVARIVDAKFTLDRIHRLKAAHPREDIGANSSLLKEESKARNCHYPLTTVPSNTAILEVEVE